MLLGALMCDSKFSFDISLSRSMTNTPIKMNIKRCINFFRGLSRITPDASTFRFRLLRKRVPAAHTLTATILDVRIPLGNRTASVEVGVFLGVFSVERFLKVSIKSTFWIRM